MVLETVGSVQVCVQQTTVPPVIFLREVELVFDTLPGTAQGESHLNYHISCLLFTVHVLFLQLTAPMDFTQVVNSAIMFPSTRCISIDINNDDAFEPDEIFFVLVSSDDAAVEFSDDEATVRITENDNMVPIGIERAAYTVEEGDSSVEVCVVANGLLTQDVQIFLLSEDGTATSGDGSE